MKNLLLTLIITTLVSSTMLAGNVIVKVVMTNGVENSYVMDENSIITYSESEMYINAIEGSVTVQIADIRKVLFEKMAGVEETAGNSISVYPNPVKDVIIMSNIVDNQDVTIYSATGSVVMKGVVTNGTIDVSSLNSGVYFVKTDSLTAKIIKL